MPRFKFTAEFEGDLDMVPGWGHDERTWHELAIAAFTRQNHYNVSARIVESTDHRNMLGGYLQPDEGWIEIEGTTKPDIDGATMVQIKSGNFPNGTRDWHRADLVWSIEQQHLREAVGTENDRITAYRPWNKKD